MPIVIEEVVISVEVGSPSAHPAVAPPRRAEDQQALVAECVERVLEILAQRQER